MHFLLHCNINVQNDAHVIQSYIILALEYLLKDYFFLAIISSPLYPVPQNLFDSLKM